MISSCGSDERGKYSGGKAGDNTGNEYKIINWYKPGKSGWSFVARQPDPKVREAIAKDARAAANNNNIGYDQLERTTFWNKLTISEYDPAKIKEPCECDCSSSSAAIPKAIGYRLNNEKLKNIPTTMWTGNARECLKAAGFEILTNSKYTASSEELLPGDILCIHTDDHKHMVINLDAGSKVTTPIQNETKKSITELAEEVKAGKWGNDPERTKKLTAAGYDAKAVQDEVNRLLGIKKSTKSSTMRYSVTAKSGLNVRKSPNGTIIGCFSYGTLLDVVSIDNGWAKLFDGHYVSANWIKKV